ncbi:MAG: cyclic nucleotide-binding domain-containing protein [Desulforhopalus sp.]
MNEIELQGKSIEALKSFNSTIVTSRLYPPEAPQVANAVDRGYKGIQSFLGRYGELTFSRKGEKLFICGQLLQPEVVESFPNLVVYRQLRQLDLPQLVVIPEMDRFAFSQLLSVFNASVEKVRKAGGGLEYITSLGLADYFPDEKEAPDEHGGGRDGAGNLLHPHTPVKVRPEIIDCLLGRESRPLIEEELQKKMADTETAIGILFACIANILKDIQEKKIIVPSSDFPLMLKKAETLIEVMERQEVAVGLAKILVQRLKDPALCVVSVQEYPEGFGSSLYDGLIGLLTGENLAGMIVFFRQQLAKAKRSEKINVSHVQFLEQGLTLMVNSEKGKHFLSAEKAKTIIHEGEKERKKRRLEAGIKGFLQGNTNLLQSEEIVHYLPAAVRQIQSQNSEAEVTLLIKGMLASLKDGGQTVKESLLQSVLKIGENLLVDSQWSHVDLISEQLMEDLRNGNLGALMAEKTLTLLQDIMQKSWKDGDNDRGDRILSLFYQIRSGKIHHPASIRAIAAKVQDRGIRRVDLPQLLAGCLASPEDKALIFRLILQGPVALRFLVESLINEDKAPDRFTIIDLLTCSSHFLPSVVQERLQEHMPWYGKRNLIKLLGETGTEKDAEILLPYLRHEDFRVQRETFLTIYKLSGNNKKKLLLRALDESAEPIKGQVVEALAGYCDAEVAGKLTDLLAFHEQFEEQNRNDLLLKLLATIGRCPWPAAHKGVHAFLQTRGQRATRRISDQVWDAADRVAGFLQSELQEGRKKHVQASQLRKNALKQAAKIKKASVAQQVISDLPQEQAVRSLLSRGNKSAAIKKVLELIERVARHRNFVQAEKLREWIIEIDPAALGQILQAAEIIDREKIAAIDTSHLEIWSELYDVLTTDEFRAVYGALEHRKYQNEERVITQGTLQGTLFFINSGKVKLHFDDNDNEVLVKTMKGGEIFGWGPFFEASVWTISVAAIETSEISLLHLETLETWADEFPGLEAKLYDFCKRFEKIEESIKRSLIDRRLNKRYRIAGRVVATLLDNRSRTVGTSFNVELADISEGGISFLARISNKESGRLLLGRKMLLSLPGTSSSEDGLTLIGEVLAVKKTYTVENDYSLHMKFDRRIDRKELHGIVMIMRRESRVI